MNLRYEDLPLADHGPITKDNPAVVALIGLLMARDMVESGHVTAGHALFGASTKMAREFGRLPRGAQIPEKVWREVVESIHASVERVAREVRAEEQVKKMAPAAPSPRQRGPRGPSVRRNERGTPQCAGRR